ncbi:hypothetical protein ACH5RR_016410 [Cinchona calisaya]|uniref:non-specific serine/threonine protein kinase n=1 Tax=Cinchona calisaya TaxID=153742 RepID=A0ABD2ZVS7_9GENT
MAQVVASLEQALELQERPMASASRNGTVVGLEEVPIIGEKAIQSQEEVPIFGENVIPSPMHGSTSQLTQNPYSPTRGNDLQLRQTDNTRVSKLSWNWLWKAVRNRGKKQKADAAILKSKRQELPVHVYSYNTLAIATNNFQSDNKIGMGGFGHVYKGILFNGQEIAVKRYLNSFRNGINEFINEFEVHSRLQHRNIVKLLGCCAEREEYLLVYEYMQNGSLDSYLFDPTKGYLLDWDRRAIIIQGIGRGLLYLHQDSSLKIIHRDPKASNILLDMELNPKISDFCLARVSDVSQDEAVSSRVAGTIGYIDPEYCMTGRVSEKSDVYSYGVLLLEIVSGKKNRVFVDDEKITLIEYAWKLWNENEILDLVDPKLGSSCNEMQIQRHVHVALLCVQASAIDRPNMSTVLSMLNSEVADLPRPKCDVSSYSGRFDSSESECSREIGQHSVSDAYPTDWVAF